MTVKSYPSVFFCPMGDDGIITDTVDIRYNPETLINAEIYFKGNKGKLTEKYKVSSVSEVSFWGVTEGMRNSWNQMKPNDLIFFTKNGLGFVYMAKISNKFEREEAELLNKNFWNNHSTDENLIWNLVFTLKDVRRISIKTSEMSVFAGYGTDYKYRSLVRLADYRSAKFLETFSIFYYFNSKKFKQLGVD